MYTAERGKKEREREREREREGEREVGGREEKDKQRMIMRKKNCLKNSHYSSIDW